MFLSLSEAETFIQTLVLVLIDCTNFYVLVDCGLGKALQRILVSVLILIQVLDHCSTNETKIFISNNLTKDMQNTSLHSLALLLSINVTFTIRSFLLSHRYWANRDHSNVKIFGIFKQPGEKYEKCLEKILGGILSIKWTIIQINTEMIQWSANKCWPCKSHFPKMEQW